MLGKVELEQSIGSSKLRDYIASKKATSQTALNGVRVLLSVSAIQFYLHVIKKQ
jgi:hypothetical protein